MKINYNVTGEQRKELVKAIGAILQIKPVYMKMPTCAYEIGDITVGKEGTLVCEDSAKAERVAHNLIVDGFIAAGNPEPAAEKAAPDEDADARESLTISMPKNGFTDETITNLEQFLKISSVSGSHKPAMSIRSSNCAESFWNSRLKKFDGAELQLSKICFQFRPHLFNGIKIRAVGR